VSLARKSGDEKEVGTDDTNNSIHSLGQVGHIEDIAVAKDQQGKKLGLRIIQALDHVAEKVGCYKVSYNPRPRRSGLHTHILTHAI
jgi:GNAT superfamily N-acetyltransferase